MVGGLAPSAKSAGIIAILLYFPTLVFSGATLPYELMPEALRKAADFLPLAQGIKLLKAASLDLPLTDALTPALLTAAVAVVCILLSLRFFRWE